MNDNLEALLRLINKTAPRSWHPRVFTESQGLPVNALDEELEHLYLDGLIKKGEGNAQTGPGVVLTDKGQHLLADPEELQRLREGKAITPGDRGGIVRELLRRSIRPVVTWILLAANFAVFGYGAYLASRPKVNLGNTFLGSFLSIDPRVFPILHYTGALSAEDLLKGQWWRLLSCCFVHFGVIHLLMNMYMLYYLGKQVEQMWGCWRYFLIYILAGLGGSCLVEAYGPGQIDKGRVIIPLLAGASGALCGLFGSEAVWMLLNRKYLPRPVARRWRNNFFTSLVLLVFISLFPGVSGLGHLGGAIAGTLVAFLLNFQRFGPNPWRWLGLPVVLCVPWAGYALIDHARATNPVWRKLEQTQFEATKLAGRTRNVMNQAIGWYQDQFEPMLRRDKDSWKGRNPEEVTKVLSAEETPLDRLTKLDTDLARAQRAFRATDIVEELTRLREYTRERIKLMRLAQEFLETKQDLTEEDLARLKAQEKKVADLRREWE